MKKILFGNKPATVAQAYTIRRDGGEVVAFVVDKVYITDTQLEGIPVVAFEDLVSRYDPFDHEVLVFLGPRNNNSDRTMICDRVVSKGFRLGTYISSFATVWDKLDLKPNTRIGDRTIVQPYVSIGRNVMIGSGCIIGHHTHISDNCFISAGVTIGGGVTVGNGCFIGLGSVIRDKIVIGDRCVIGSGVTLQENADEGSVYLNTSARKMPFLSDQISY